MNDDIKAIRERLVQILVADNGCAACGEVGAHHDDCLLLQSCHDLADLCDELEVWRQVGTALGVDGPAAALAEVLRLRALLRWREGEVPRG